MKTFNKLFSLIILGSCLLFAACDDEATNSTLGPVASGFVNSSSSTTENSGSPVTVSIGFEAGAPESGTLVVDISETVATSSDYTTNPAASGGQINLAVAEGDNNTSFTVTPVDNSLVDGDKTLTFTLNSASNGVRLGDVSLNHTMSILEDDGIVLDTIGNTMDNCTGSGGSSSIPAPFFEENVPGSNPFAWGCTSFGNFSGAATEYNAFSSNSSVPSDAWLILNLNDLQKSAGGNVANADLTGLTVEVYAYSRFSGNGELNLMYSQNYSGSGDPSAATWSTVSDFATQLPAGGSRVWTKVTANVDAVTGATNGYIAFRHTGGIGGSTEVWRLDDFTFYTKGVE